MAVRADLTCSTDLLCIIDFLLKLGGISGFSSKCFDFVKSIAVLPSHDGQTSIHDFEFVWCAVGKV